MSAVRSLEPAGGSCHRQLPHVPAAAVPVLHRAAARLSDGIVHAICSDIAAFKPPGRPRRKVRDAVTIGIAGFLDPAAAEASRTHFRGIGAGLQGRADLVAILHALHVASDSVARTIVTLAEHESLAGTVVGGLMADATRYVRGLVSEVQLGHLEATQLRLSGRATLARAIVTGRAERPVEELVAETGWVIPEIIVLVTADLNGAPAGAGRPWPDQALMHVDGSRVTALAPPEQAGDALTGLLQLGPRVVAAQSWQVPVALAPHAYQWTRRALGLVRAGRIQPKHRIVRCVEHQVTLWEAADDALGKEIGRALLAPLADLTPGRRLGLAETLSRSLTSRESANAMARHLGVHPNTVHNRLHVLRELFGDRLDDPVERAELVLALRRMLPVWRDVRRR